MYAWGDNDHGQQGSGTTTVNRKPALVQGLDGYKITKVACGSSHSIAWCTMDTAPNIVHEPVLFFTTKDPLGAGHMGRLLRISYLSIVQLLYCQIAVVICEHCGKYDRIQHRVSTYHIIACV